MNSKTKIFKRLSLSFLCIGTLTANLLANAQTGPGWSAPTTVTDLRVFNGDQIFGWAADLNPIVSCPNQQTNTKSFYLDNNTTYFDEVYSLLLAAQLSGKRVRLYRTGDCNVNHATINGARLVD